MHSIFILVFPIVVPFKACCHIRLSWFALRVVCMYSLTTIHVLLTFFSFCKYQHLQLKAAFLGYVICLNTIYQTFQLTYCVNNLTMPSQVCPKLVICISYKLDEKVFVFFSFNFGYFFISFLCTVCNDNGKFFLSNFRFLNIIKDTFYSFCWLIVQLPTV